MKLRKSKVCVCSDFHLGLHQSNNTWHNISINFALWLKKQLLEQQIEDIIILGDVIDNRNEVSVTTLHILYKFFKILEDFNVVIITGNHDCYYSKRSDVHSLGTLNDWPNIEVIDKPLSVNLYNKNLTFCPWNTQLNDIPKSDVLFGHFEINTFKMNSNHICEHGTDSHLLLEKSSLILTGHFHNTDERNYKNGKILYTGSPYEQNWGEANHPKGIYILDIKELKLNFIINNYSPKHVKIRLSELLAVGKITDNIKNEFEGNIINFIIDVETDQKILDALLTKFYTFNPISIKTENALLIENIVSNEDEIAFEGIDIKHDIIEFVKSVEGVENKDNIVNYLMDVYDQCDEVKK